VYKSIEINITSEAKKLESENQPNFSVQRMNSPKTDSETIIRSLNNSSGKTKILPRHRNLIEGKQVVVKNRINLNKSD
jgi:hypothetical protein